MVGVGLVAGLLAGCTGGASIPGISGFGAKPEPVAETPAAVPGGIRVALILPLTAAGNVGAAGTSLKNAAEMAAAEFNNPKFQLLLKDDTGTPDGARTAAQQALAEGADIIIGPLLAPSVQAVGQVARAAGKPVIAFSTDASVAGPGVYLLSFLPETEVDPRGRVRVLEGQEVDCRHDPEHGLRQRRDGSLPGSRGAAWRPRSRNRALQHERQGGAGRCGPAHRRDWATRPTRCSCRRTAKAWRPPAPR